VPTVRAGRFLATGLLGVALLSGGCRTVVEGWDAVFWTSDVITYDQYLAIDAEATPKPSVDDVIGQLGTPVSVHDRNGARVRIDYRAFSLNDELKRAEFHFDTNEKLMKKEMW
jgi:hypothetical protein